MHPIALLACGPGTGKSRFLQEVEKMLREKADTSGDEDVKNAFSNMLSVNITYGNGTSASKSDTDIGGEASVAVRLLYEFFISTDVAAILPKISLEDIRSIPGVSKLELMTAVKVIYSDFISRGKLEPSVLVLGIDEVNTLYSVNEQTLREAVRAVGRLSCNAMNPFCIPILAGTIQGPVENMIRESTYRLLLPPLPLLTEDDVIYIGSKLCLTENNKVLRLTEDYLRDDILFRRSINDIGGMARAVEVFYNNFTKQMKMIDHIPKEDKALTEVLRNVDTAVVMENVAYELNTLYSFSDYIYFVTPVLAKAILDIPVDMNDPIIEDHNEGEDSIKKDDKRLITYKDLRTTGIINLEPVEQSNNCYIRIPYMWLKLLVHASKVRFGDNSPLRFWKDYINPKQDVEWESWEKFNIQFLALRLCLFSVLKRKTITLKELFSGAEFTPNFINFEIEVPTVNSVRVTHLLDRYPVAGTGPGPVGDVDGIKYNNLYHDYNIVFTTGAGSLVDGFTRLRLSQGQGLGLGIQMKFSQKDSKKPSIIDMKLVKGEYVQFAKAIDILKNRSQDLEYTFGILSNHNRVADLKLTDIVEHTVKTNMNKKADDGKLDNGKMDDGKMKDERKDINFFMVHREF